ncbi:hypothetical protein A3D77_06415 [Candidatus Gottesmanbacteria bacterium RIFCSPHIGHO2_02_FULL_39_11]|uniref:Transposase IS200-like domain-containing protein n=1 Tax=Candidatus Gottesmanbacteria bacterium RIFCSPHIGHO2_02_FULL_39_11 TaxID=1798382 RepID=A0A1F5ZXV9_9BACT|nr:MAG: hypothetical protein A3D77_06415 [Candidatus Gottesmanbacteria bacterium RIFCSPHIGHO2_02_FULL_39_11]
MPKRLEPFLINHYYHIFNRLIDGHNFFKDHYYSSLFLDLLSYYLSNKATLSYSKFKRTPTRIQNEISLYLDYEKYHKVDIIAYCLMPTHFHILVRQKFEGGIVKYISDVINSFTRKYNLENRRKGPLFLPRFKSVSVVSDNQFIHVSRYIHLNPYSSGIINKVSNINKYPYSSLREYMGESKLCKPNWLLSYFGMNKDKYTQFVLDNADYQKSLEELKYTDKW